MKNLILIIFIQLAFCSISYKRSSESFACKTCHKLVNSIKTVEHILDPEVTLLLDKVGTQYCIDTMKFQQTVCSGIVEKMIPSIQESIVEHYLSSDEICPFIFACPKVYQKLDFTEYKNEVLQDKPLNSDWPQVDQNGQKVKVIHISDIHFDFKYKEGAKVKCDQPVCCREESGPVIQGEQTAQHWGTVASCNLPQRTVEEFIKFMKREIYNPNDQFIVLNILNYPYQLIWTGDNTSHDVWELTRDETMEFTKVITNLLKEQFNGADNIIIVPQTGNHEAFPDNVFDYQSARETDFRQELTDLWKDWIGEQQAQLLKQKGYYKIEPNSANLKIIAFDSNVCNDRNWYLIKDPTDPSGFLEYLRQELYESEKKNQGVYIMAHIYTSACLREWAQRYKVLVDRFSATIRNQIYGHSHGETFNLYRSYLTNETINVGFISSSVTTMSFRNPSFRVFEIDKDTAVPLNYFQYRLDLDEANKNNLQGPLQWKLVFNFLEEYGVQTMRPKDLDQLANRVLTDKELAKKFQYNENAGYGGYPANPNQRGIYCKLKSSHPDELQICLTGSSYIDDQSWVLENLRGPWKKRIQN